MNDEITSQNNEEIQTLIGAASSGLMGLALMAMKGDGKGASLANLDAIEAGDAFIETTVIFTRRGVSAEGHFCSHGGKAHLFTVNAMDTRKTSH